MQKRGIFPKIAVFGVKSSRTPPRLAFWLVFVSIFVVFTSVLLPVSVAAISPADTYVVVLDAGHGGRDGGVCGTTTGASEAELNLCVTRLLEGKLSARGVKVVLTRKNNEGLVADTVKNFKLRDMEERKKIIDRASPDCVVSIHMNFYPSSVRRGTQVFMSDNRVNSKEFAKVLQSKINSDVNLPTNGRAFSPLSGDFYIVECTKTPSIIVECGFLSNPLDDALLNTEEFRDSLTTCLADGIMTFLASRA